MRQGLPVGVGPGLGHQPLRVGSPDPDGPVGMVRGHQANQPQFAPPAEAGGLLIVQRQGRLHPLFLQMDVQEGGGVGVWVE